MRAGSRPKDGVRVRDATFENLDQQDEQRGLLGPGLAGAYELWVQRRQQH